MSVTAIIVTRGDVDYTQTFASIPREWEILVWNNGSGECEKWTMLNWYPFERIPASDLSVYGRYAAIEHAKNDLIYVQDDDCVVSDPQAIVDAWINVGITRAVAGRSTFISESEGKELPEGLDRNFVVCNMPPEFRHGFYEEHSLVGFGAAFHRHVPARAFSTFFKAMGATLADYSETVQSLAMASQFGFNGDPDFFQACDVVFTALTPRILVDVPKENLPWATDENRMYRRYEHQAERGKMLELAFRARDADV